MEHPRLVFETIYKEVTRDDPDVRSPFLHAFQTEIVLFTEAMSDAFVSWRKLDDMVEGDTKRAFVSGLTYTTIFIHIQSMKAFLSGLTIASGNLQRQVVESIAMTLLCSHKSLSILELCLTNKYRSYMAVADLEKHQAALGLKEGAWHPLNEARKFYHNYSHPTMLTMAVHIPLNPIEKGIYVGATYDGGKTDSYRKHVNNMVGLAKVFKSFIYLVRQNTDKWSGG